MQEDGSEEDVKKRRWEGDGDLEVTCTTHNASNMYLFVNNGVEDNPGETIVLEWGELGGLMEDEHCGHLRC